MGWVCNLVFAQDKDIKYYFVQQPYRAPLAKRKKVKNALVSFASKMTKVVSKNGGNFLSLHKTLQLDDKYFADRSHLNDQGSILAAKAIGRFIDDTEK